MIKMIDIVEIKNKVNKNEILFYVKDSYIYCENIRTGECVIVGYCKEV